ncbi:N-acetylmuramoyl-L-alanine amidase [Paenibacillus chondroitinus]|uniref:N-acetylmuramoyl-L-alanine amidase n=1 Tax=Paenibacillus chondroitinus TaxID=59842 RepID=A0ABU6DJI2_9BACL|nr:MULTISPECIES: N-acetylmuramoyl-L-alanine amidase [Paenibacillus]MCY9661020.1 N-acetylmuramoyl-L-alanine amidase [Paenibacillus anseongense]MEB4797921.1 N-acetylmuramoyl-L-alanine amidase [Paenibacillus chondroitinus]
MMVGKKAIQLVVMGVFVLVVGCGGVPQEPEMTAAVQEPTPVSVVQERELVPVPAVQAAEPQAAPVEALPAARKLVMLDPGHQRHGNNEPEAVGPDTREVKPKVSSGTVGVRTKKPEYVLNLEVSQLVKAELVKRGIEVAMTRESHEVDISNKQRAEMANEAGAVLAVRIHADGDSSPKTSGFSVLYPSAASAALKPIAAESRQAAGFIAEQLKAATGTAGRGLSARSDLSGFNWSKVPVVLVELGFMTNPEEDERLSEAEHQQKLATGIADGIERFLNAGS